MIRALVVLAAVCAMAYACDPEAEAQTSSMPRDVQRFVDGEHGVVCYYVPQAHCIGNCAYSPAISCVKP